MTKVLSFGDRIRPGDYTLHSRFSRAVNFMRQGRLASVVAPAVGGGPINIVMAGCDLSSLSRLEVADGSFSLDGESFPKSPLFDSRPPKPRGLDLRQLRELLLRKAHPKSLAFLLDSRRCRNLASGFESALVRRLQEAARSLRRGDLEAGAKAARGAGLGLTPSGDDLLCGYLWGLHLRGAGSAQDVERVYAQAQGQNPLSSAFLDCAREGRFFAPLKELMAEPSEARLDAVLASGETSGADTCVGLILALDKEEPLWS
ncbi:MAG: DUF2877 domain-containing protein [Elusimicrobia bacterium]|nr:DUF2877 domain-containing protein [Elusimicrobiota bacterium]